jgi:very-short-patch-repair endonuclease
VRGGRQRPLRRSRPERSVALDWKIEARVSVRCTARAVGQCVATPCARQAGGLRGEAHVGRRAPRLLAFRRRSARVIQPAPARLRPPTCRAQGVIMHLLPPSRHRALLLASRASALRKFSTLSERRLWQELSGGRVLGVRFRRQVVVGPFIADFLAPGLRLIVEVDGPVHARTARADARRDEKFAGLGIGCSGWWRSKSFMSCPWSSLAYARRSSSSAALREGAASSRVVPNARWGRPFAVSIEEFLPLVPERSAPDSGSMSFVTLDDFSWKDR